MLNLRKIGGIHFLRIGRLNMSFSISRKRAPRAIVLPASYVPALTGTPTPQGYAWFSKAERDAFEASRS